MDDELEYQIRVVLDKELDDLKHWESTWKLQEEKGKKFIKYPNSDTLIDIFSNIQNQPEQKVNFVKNLCEKIEKSGEGIEKKYNNRGPDYYQYISKSSICFYSLIRIGFTKEAIASYTKRVPHSGSLTLLIEDVLEEDFSYFDKKDLDELLTRLIKNKLKGPAEKKRELTISKIIKNRYDQLKKEIRGINLEINQDKKSLSEKISYLDFDDKYNELLNEIDKFINIETSNIVNAGMISNLRSFMADLLTDIAKRISKINNESIPKIEGFGEMGNVRNYLKIHLELSDNDHKFINSFIDILHSQGGHSFMSKKEYFRLSRNIAIEIALFIISKYEAQFSGKK